MVLARSWKAGMLALPPFASADAGLDRTLKGAGSSRAASRPGTPIPRDPSP
jgi:hypothetical protein